MVMVYKRKKTVDDTSNTEHNFVIVPQELTESKHVAKEPLESKRKPVSENPSTHTSQNRLIE